VHTFERVIAALRWTATLAAVGIAVAIALPGATAGHATLAERTAAPPAVSVRSAVVVGTDATSSVVHLTLAAPAPAGRTVAVRLPGSDHSWPCAVSGAQSVALICPIDGSVSPSADGQPVDVEVLV
jgi:hypothetical protein